MLSYSFPTTFVSFFFFFCPLLMKITICPRMFLEDGIFAIISIVAILIPLNNLSALPYENHAAFISAKCPLEQNKPCHMEHT